MGFWDRKKVLVTGGAGFIGSHVVEELLRRGKGLKVTVADNLSTGHLDNLAAVKKDVKLMKADFLSLSDCLKACKGQDVVLNLAAKVAGVGYNSTHHATMFRDNLAVTSNMLEAARKAGVERFLVVSSACVYSRHCKIPTPESEGFKDEPEETNRGYGWAKRMAEYLGRAYQQEFGLKVAIARPYNAYGPRDHYGSKDAHVIPSLVRRAVAGEDPFVVWGDGTATRAFLYVEDAARGLLELTERYAEADPVNIGTEEEVTVRQLAELVLRLAGSKAKLKFDTSKPTGQPRRNCDSRKAKEVLGFSTQVALHDGLRRSVEWYKAHRKARGK
jgi:GDP-L-fucose synthase